jgi:HlyD family secretion protein
LKKLLLTLIIVALVVVAGWIYRRETAAPEVPFTKVRRETLISTVETNGKVQPIEWAAVRAERAGAVNKVAVKKGDRVAKGALLVELDASDARADLASAEAEIAQAKADLEVLEQGGKAEARVEIENSLASARVELNIAKRDLAALTRLAEKQAVTAQEVTAARERVEKAELQIQALEKKRSALVSPVDLRAAKARLSSAEASAQHAQERIQLSIIRSPMAGLVYDLEVRPGSYVQAGDLIAEVGRLDKVRVIVYVDEPELGRVGEGMPLTITWDALPGKQWKGTVERVPTEVVAFGTRQVGEVSGIIDNPDRDLRPGANVNAEIRSQVVDNALTIPKEALRREGSEVGVFLLEGDHVVWRPVKTGVTNITRAQITEGLKDGDAIALPTDVTLRNGTPVRASFQ